MQAHGGMMAGEDHARHTLLLQPCPFRTNTSPLPRLPPPPLTCTYLCIPDVDAAALHVHRHDVVRQPAQGKGGQIRQCKWQYASVKGGINGRG